MFIALTTLITKLGGLRAIAPPPRSAPPQPVRPREPSRCFEVLVPYHDAREAVRNGMPLSARHSLVVTVWAPSAAKALDCARERFRDHRRRNRTATMAPEGPVALRIATEIEVAAAL